ncbi:hypothetical protein O4H26_09030 [Aequorivita viscosa]|nr:hypothetical protein [Aequorivita viscosa]
MTLSILPLVNWGMGTAIIIFFAVLCVGLSALVLSFVFSGKKKDEDEDEVTSSEKDKI